MRPARRYCRCGTLLARDNTARLCSLCQSKRQRDHAPAVPPEFWLTEPMAGALDSGDLGRVLRAYRLHPFHGQPLSQCIVAGWLHVSQATLSRIESGHRRLTVDEIAGFARALGHDVAVRWTPLHDTGEDVDPLSRRSLLGAGVGAALGLNATTAPAATRQTDPEFARHWMELMVLLYRHDAMFGPHDVVAPVQRELGLIAEHRQLARGGLRADLLRVESRWSLFASWLAHDTGNWGTRDDWADRALRLAQAAAYPDMVAWVRLRESQWAATQDEPQRAIALADSAGRTPGISGRMRALCTLRQAHGHALANDAAACERRLADAHDGLVGRGPTGDDDPCDELAGRDLTAPYVLAAEARCWITLRPHKAIPMLEDVLRTWPPDRTRGRGVHRARLALACAAANEPDRAAAEGLKALDIAHATRSHVTMRELRRLDRRLAACDTRAAADFREALAAA
jgi:transcriptional regulator with XRE-family HTH domain